jgi:hypothetical protein
MLMIIAITSFSCAHGNPEKKKMTVATTDHEETNKQYLKGVEESKKHVVARVNGVEITLYRLIDRMNQIAPNLLRSHERTPGIDDWVKREALSILIFRELAIQEAVRLGIKAPPEQIDETLEKIKATAGSEDEFKKFLNTTGKTEESLRKDIGRNLLFDMIIEQEVVSHAKKGGRGDTSAELRRVEWEKELKKGAKIEITLDEVEKKLREEAEKNNSQ